MSGVPLNKTINPWQNHLMGEILDILPKQTAKPSGMEKTSVKTNMSIVTPVPDNGVLINEEKESQLLK